MLYKLLLSHLKQLYLVVKVGVVYVGAVLILKHLKEELAWATDEQLQVINRVLF